MSAKDPYNTNNNKKAVIEGLKKSKGIISTACESANISRVTFYDWMKTDEDFKAQVDEINEACIDWVESKLQEKINGVPVLTMQGVYEQPPSDTAIIFYLKTKAKARGYIERTEQVQITEQPLFGGEDDK